MSPDQRWQAAQHFWTGKADIEPVRKDEAFAVIAKARGTREKTVRRAPIDQLTTWTAKILFLPTVLANTLVRTYLFHEHQKMIGEFLDSLGVPHTQGIVREEFDPAYIPQQTLIASASCLTARYGAEVTELYFGYVIAQSDSWSEALRGIPSHTPTETELFPSDDPIKIEQVAPGEDRLTNLDELVGQAIAATIAGSDGALDREQVEEVIQEILQANPHRDKTFYHKGYLDVILDRPIPSHFREENRDRRLWYLTGAIQALDDRADTTSLLKIFKSENLADLGREKKHRSMLGAGPIFKALCHENRAAAAASFLAPDMVFYVDLFHWTLEFGTSLLRKQEFESARSLFRLLDSAIQGLNAEQIASLGPHYFDLKRREAHCLRFQRHFKAATKILITLLDTDSAPERSAMAVDVGLMKEGFRGLLDVVIPEHDLHGFIDRLERIRPQLEAALSYAGDTGHASYCLGVLAVAKQTDPETAAEYLDKSVTSMLRQRNVYDLGHLLNHAKFYMGLARAEALNPSFAESARVLFEESITSGFIPPDHLLRRYFVGLSVINSDCAKRAAETTLSKLGAARVLESVLDIGAASESEPILSALLEWATDEKRPGKRRFHDLECILNHALAGNHKEIAAAALDGMEQLARDRIQPDRFLAILLQPGRFHPAWSPSDAAWSAVGVHELFGKDVDARSLLEQEFHRALAEEQYGFLELAEDILDRMRKLGADESGLIALEKRLAAKMRVRLDLAPTRRNEKPVRITVVGGAERQASYDRAILDVIAAETVAVHVEFRHTGWNGNWGSEFDAMRSSLDRLDAVVVMRLIRTNLGRAVRESANLWIGCAGDSKSSIVRAIRLGVDLARRERTASA
jgi:hypothetical protein